MMKVKEDSEKADLKLNIQEIKIMASSPITSWQIEGEKMKTVADFIFLVSKTTLDSNCSHKVKRWLLLGRKAMANLDNGLKSRDVALLTKVHLCFSISHVWRVGPKRRLSAQELMLLNCGVREDS